MSHDSHRQTSRSPRPTFLSPARVPARTLAASVAIALLAAAPLLASGADGRLYDPGIERTERSPGAPEELDAARFLLGSWVVEIETPRSGAEPVVSSGRAEITYMNRGHGLMERFRSADFDGAGTPRVAMAFLVYNPAGALWARGEADSLTESIAMADGGFDGGALVLSDAERRGGGMRVTHARSSWRRDGAGFRRVDETSTDHGASWSTARTWVYREAPDGPAAWAGGGEGFGAPAHSPSEARDFEFMIGEWRSSHELTQAPGSVIRWPSNSTAVWALDGRAVYEFDWFDVDPSLPDAATSILRVYNRAERRWECLFAPNRFHSLLHFGGRREGDRVVLHRFNVDTAGAFSRFVFHDIEKDRYGWFAETSRDRGRTFTKTWVIEIERAQPTPGPTGPVATPGG